MMKLSYFLSLILTYFTASQVFAHDSNHESGNEYPFVKNQGQWHNNVKYRAEINGAYLYLENSALHYQFVSYPDFHANAERDPSDTLIKGHTFKAQLVGANPEPFITEQEASSYYYNYYKGNDSSKWASNVHSYQEVNYAGVYPGIDMRLYSFKSSLKYDYIVAPGSDPSQIIIDYQGVDEIDIRKGELFIRHSVGTLIEEAPYAYQKVNGEYLEVECRFKKNEAGQITFEFPNGYRSDLPLTIDPTLIFSTYSGSRSGNFGATATYDSLGFGYMGGTIFANAYNNTVGGFQSSFQQGDSDIAISKFSRDGSQLIYSTFLGGNQTDVPTSMVVDKNLSLIVLGTSNSTNYPTTPSAYDRVKDNSLSIDLTSGYGWGFQGGCDIVITKFNIAGSALLGSTFLGGNGADGLNYNDLSSNSNISNFQLVYNYGDHFRGEVIVDNQNNIYVGSSTTSSNLANAQNSNQGGQDGLIAKFNPTLSNLIWLRYHGGNRMDAIYSLKVISNNRVLVGGGTNSTANFPIRVPSYQSLAPGGRADGFVSIISADGLSIDRTTFVGTGSYDQVYFVEYDRFGSIYCLGQTLGNFPIINSSIADSSGQFILKLDSNLRTAQFSHRFGDTLDRGLINISPTAFLVDRCLNIYVSGWGASLFGATQEGPKSLPNAMRISPGLPANQTITDGQDFYIYAINRDVDSVLFASFFGDPTADDHVDGGTSRFDKQGIIYQSACASCATLPTASRFPTTPNSYAPNKNVTVGGNTCNNALLKYDLEILPRANFAITRVSGCEPYTARIFDRSTNASQVFWEYRGTRFQFNNDTTLNFSTPGTYTLKQFAIDTICNSTDVDSIIITVFPNTINAIIPQDTISCNLDSIPLTVLSNGTAKEFYWSTSSNFSDTLNAPGDSSIKVEPSSNLVTYYIQLTDSSQNSCTVFDSVKVRYIPFGVNATISADTICVGSTIQLNSTSTNLDSSTWKLGDGRLIANIGNPSVTYNQPGTYSIKLVGQNNSCNERDSVTLQLEVVPNNLRLSSIPDSIYCGTDTIVLQENSQGTANSFLWSSNPSFSDTLNQFPNDSVIKIFSNTNSSYYIKIEDDRCSLQDTVQINYTRYELGLNNLPDSGCAPFNININPQLTGTTAFEINFGNGNGTTSNPNPSPTYPNEGVYIVELIGSNSLCQRSDTLRDTVKVLPEVVMASIADTLVCRGDTIQLSASSLGTADNFLWDTLPSFPNPINIAGDSLLQFVADTSYRFYVKGIKSICEAEENFLLDIEVVEVDLDDLLSICIGDTLDIQAIPIRFRTPLSYDWQPQDSIIGSNTNVQIKVAPKSSLDFYLNTNSNLGCEAFDTVTVDVQQPAFSTAEIISSSDSVLKGSTIPLSSNRNGSNLIYRWEPAALLDNPNSPNPRALVNTDTTFTLTIIDLNTGCEVVTSKRLKVYEILCDEPEIFIPTAFTPNGDGNNDILRVRGSNLLEIELEIYSRWGELVFKTDQLNQGWDGRFQGKEMDPGVFVYHLTARCIDGQDFYSQGNITLIR